MTGEAENWRPIPEELQQVVQLLQHSQSPDTQTQRNVQEVCSHNFYYFLLCNFKLQHLIHNLFQRLDQLNLHPEFCCCLVFILSELKEEQVLLLFVCQFL